MESVIVAMVVIAAFPFVVYTTAKVWTYGTLRGQELYRKSMRHSVEKD